MHLATLHLSPFPEYLLDGRPQRFCAINDEQIPPILLQPARRQILALAKNPRKTQIYET
jgi:hypothetical protein